MTTCLSHYKFSRREIARHRCLDCGVNVIEAGDYCMLQPDIWERQFALGWRDNLCIACIERRLSRELTLADFCCLASVEGFPSGMSRVVARLGLDRPKRKRRGSAS
jgi:hypothetical protein